MIFKKNKDFIELLLYLVVAVVLIYYVPSPLNKILFLSFLPLAWITKRDYLWLAFFYIIEDIPGGLFSGGLATDAYRLPLYTVISDVSFSIRELYLLLILVKVLIKQEYRREFQRNYFSKELNLLGYYLILLLIISAFLGISFEGLKNFYKVCVNLTLFISVFSILRNREYFQKFFNTIFPFAIIAILFQFYSLTFHQQFIALLKPGVLTAQGVLSDRESAEIWQRPIEMVHVLLVCFIGSLFFLHKSEKSFKTTYLITINLISFLGIFLTGTRTWFLALSILYIYIFLTRIGQFSFASIKNMIIITVLIIGFGFIPVINKQISNAWSRLSTLEMVAQGDITAGGTASRYDVRAPKVMEGFGSSTLLFGAGFSKLYYKYQDGHVGYHNMLLNSGIIGVMLFAIIILKAIYLPYYLSKVKILSAQSKHELRTSILLLISLLILNTGTQTIGYTPDGGNRFLLMALALSIINQAINSALKDKRAREIPYQNHIHLTNLVMKA